MSVALAAAAALLTFPYLTHAQVTAPRQSRAIVIDDDHGGQIDTFVMWYKRLAESGVSVRLRGICESACTFVLTLPQNQVCVEPTASLGFHLATIDDRPEPGVTRALIERHYPEAVKTWLKDKRLRMVPVYMDAATIVNLGIFSACDVQAEDIEQ